MQVQSNTDTPSFTDVYLLVCYTVSVFFNACTWHIYLSRYLVLAPLLYFQHIFSNSKSKMLLAVYDCKGSTFVTMYGSV